MTLTKFAQARIWSTSPKRPILFYLLSRQSFDQLDVVSNAIDDHRCLQAVGVRGNRLRHLHAFALQSSLRTHRGLSLPERSDRGSCPCWIRGLLLRRRSCCRCGCRCARCAGAAPGAPPGAPPGPPRLHDRHRHRGRAPPPARSRRRSTCPGRSRAHWERHRCVGQFSVAPKVFMYQARPSVRSVRDEVMNVMRGGRFRSCGIVDELQTQAIRKIDELRSWRARSELPLPVSFARVGFRSFAQIPR